MLSRVLVGDLGAELSGIVLLATIFVVLVVENVSIFNEQKCSIAVGPQLLFLQGMSLRLGGVVLVGRYPILLFSCFITMKGELLGKWR